MLPFRVESYLKDVVWGGDAILRFKGLDGQSCEPRTRTIGESWEVSAIQGKECRVCADEEFGGSLLSEVVRDHGLELMGREVYQRYGGEFPLLCKYIDARDNLSVQVHPNDDLARARHGCSGKNEVWYVLEAQTGAKLAAGFKRQITAEEFEQPNGAAALCDALAWHETHVGDVFYLPAGRVHAIGAGNFILEVQQPSDITYRIYDYDRRDATGRLRDLHIAEAKDAIDYSVCENYRQIPKGDELISTPWFRVRKAEVSGKALIMEDCSFTVLMCVKGQVDIRTQAGYERTIGQGQTMIVPADVAVEASGSGILIIVNP